ncbi:hypothetical protein J4573_00485 [Actinomadura barringtoniae]|uniref:Uncharacterized protein n=1 Tax=Actinomadura barringtoniae TaxID=1427535 RepID=A0A939P5F0_9ACTN|nr:hypothetical protein [Actinomadura barringtoniae]MBO2445557.1 hypothetical protein [Actinomadura barringtoniae]
MSDRDPDPAKKPFSKRTRTKEGRTYYDNVYASSLEEAYERYGESHMEGAEVDIVPADADDLDRGDRGLSYP